MSRFAHDFEDFEYNMESQWPSVEIPMLEDNDDERCPGCMGQGAVITNYMPPPNEPAHYETAVCGDCQGTGKRFHTT